MALEVAVRQIIATSESTKSSRHIVDKLPKVKEAMDRMLLCIFAINKKLENMFIYHVRMEGQWDPQAETSLVQRTCMELTTMNESNTRLNEIVNRMDNFVLGEVQKDSVSKGDKKDKKDQITMMRTSCSYREQVPCNLIGGNWGRGAGMKLEHKRRSMRSQQILSNF